MAEAPRSQYSASRSMGSGWASGEVELARFKASPGERRLALCVAIFSLVVFAVLVPFAQSKLPTMPFFISVYESVLVITDLLTVMLLLKQFGTTRDAALIPLMAGYLFTAATAVVHALTYPDLFAPTGLLGAGPQTTAWLYMFWHAGLPLAVILYAFIKGQGFEATGTTAMLVILTTVGLVALISSLTVGHTPLPDIMNGSSYTPVMKFVVGSVWGLSALALVVLWRRRSDSVLDTWLMVVLCAWLADIGLSAVFNAARFDLGFYTGRVYGLMAASFILVVLFEPRGLNRYRI